MLVALYPAASRISRPAFLRVPERHTTTTSFGLHLFKYIFGNEDMYSIFALVLGVSQIGALIVFPLFSKRFKRRQLYFSATILVLLGYLIFYFFDQSILTIGLAGVLLFVGQALHQKTTFWYTRL